MNECTASLGPETETYTRGYGGSASLRFYIDQISNLDPFGGCAPILCYNHTKGQGPWCDKGLLTWEKYWNYFLYSCRQYRIFMKSVMVAYTAYWLRSGPSGKCLVKKRRKG